MSVSQKLNNLFTEGIGEKSVKHLPGIGDKNSKKLQRKGFNMARQIYGRYLVMNNQEEFEKWLMNMLGSSSAITRKQVLECSSALEEIKTNLS